MAAGRQSAQTATKSVDDPAPGGPCRKRQLEPNVAGTKQYTCSVDKSGCLIVEHLQHEGYLQSGNESWLA